MIKPHIDLLKYFMFYLSTNCLPAVLAVFAVTSVYEPKMASTCPSLTLPPFQEQDQPVNTSAAAVKTTRRNASVSQ